MPSWDEGGKLWLKRTTTEAADKNFLSAQVYRNLQDGLPMWLHTEVKLTVAGKSREEELGNVIPDGWQISSMNVLIPCAVDDKGLLKAQVRAGKWTVRISAFRTTPTETISYKSGAKPMVAEELISLQNEAGFRLIEFTDIPAVDVAQTTFPDKWRSLPLHQWDTSQAFRIIEKMRGMGEKKPPGLKMKREFWLDEDGRQLTYRDEISGSSLETWRLDAAEGQNLGAAKIGGKSQLITRNPVTYEWIFLLIGLTQLPFSSGIFVVGWLFWVSLRGRYGYEKLPEYPFNFNQLLIVLLAVPVVGILLAVLHKGLLGSPEMRILGESSSGSKLVWFQARGEGLSLPVPTVVSVSIWYYRGLMLIWAVWLAFAVLRWGHWSWQQLGKGGFWKKFPKKQTPEIPTNLKP